MLIRLLELLSRLFPGETGRFNRDFRRQRYDLIVERAERQLAKHGPSFQAHHRLGVAYSCLHQTELAAHHLQAEIDWLHAHPRSPLLGRGLALASEYSNLAGVLEQLGRVEEAWRAVLEGLAHDARCGFLHLQRARQLAANGQLEEALPHLEAAFRDPRIQPKGPMLLFACQDQAFEALRQNPRFQATLRQAAMA